MRPIVVSFVRKVTARGYSHAWNDIEQTAWEGLSEAVHSYDEMRGVKFWTWATWRMRKHVSIWLAANSGGISLPYPAWQAALQMDRYLDENGLEADQVSDETLREIAGTLQVREILNARNGSTDVYEFDKPDDPWQDDIDQEALELVEFMIMADEEDALDAAYNWCAANGFDPNQIVPRLVEVVYENRS
jgi:DNA-directed RNA polymerase specialized sigma subunit